MKRALAVGLLLMSFVAVALADGPFLPPGCQNGPGPNCPPLKPPTVVRLADGPDLPPAPPHKPPKPAADLIRLADGPDLPPATPRKPPKPVAAV
jgi:hypothetical protein